MWEQSFLGLIQEYFQEKMYTCVLYIVCMLVTPVLSLKLSLSFIEFYISNQTPAGAMLKLKRIGIFVHVGFLSECFGDRYKSWGSD